jgi:hypothetical protein
LTPPSRKESEDMKYKITIAGIDEITDEEKAELSAENFTPEAIHKFWEGQINSMYPHLKPITVQVERIEP